ncbi:MAG: magnesium-transporting ATPase (P-type) [Lentimonas sp.]|jgi:magnesium-transporting ATPase (P-type)
MHVIRNGEATIIASRELVPGEIFSLSRGDRIPADLRLISAHDFHADESALTGESVPAKKALEPIDRPDLSPGDQHCMAFNSTFATGGSALGIVVETGEHTEIGKIAVLMKEIQAPLTPLQSKIVDFTRTLIIAILLIGVLNFALGHYVGYALGYNSLGSISLIVAAIPEMLPMIVTGILALSATRMAQRNALIRRLPAAETLGGTTVICSDKTGTLTTNEMTVQAILCADSCYEVHGVGYDPDGFFISDQAPIDQAELPSALRETLRTGLRCNDANLVKEGAHINSLKVVQ